jgi:hypothetical protein
MNSRIDQWLDNVVETLADARAMLACFAVDHPALIASIDAALDQAQTLKHRAFQP